MNHDETNGLLLDSLASQYYDKVESLFVIETIFSGKTYVGSVFSKISLDGAYRF